MIKSPQTVTRAPDSKIHNRTVRSLCNAAYFEARGAEVHNRAVLRNEWKRRRRAKGRQHVTGDAASSISSPAILGSAKPKSDKPSSAKSARTAGAKKRRGVSAFRSPNPQL